MKIKKSLLLSLMILLILVLAGSTKALDCGYEMTTIDNEIAYHNGIYHGCTNGCGNCAGIGIYGGQYQCVELVNRFFDKPTPTWLFGDRFIQ